MQPNTQKTIETGFESQEDFIAGILEGYRFSVCRNAREIAEALEVRRQVYVGSSGYEIPVPDAYDPRSWLLIARDMKTQKVVGTVRITPRFGGPLEAEEYFKLPGSLRSAKAFEISRFAILPEYRKGKTFLPVVSLGLFKCVMRFLESLDADYMVICSKPEKIWTYTWMRFQSTGLRATYEKLNNAEHELLWYDFRHAAEILEGHPFQPFFVELDYDQVVIPSDRPALGLHDGSRRVAYLRAVGA
jgi:N-acyl-L-homoserine lactone synthetase